MRFLKHVFDFYINSSIHVALAVYALSWITLLEFGLPYDENVLYFIFYASVTGYNFVKFFGLAKFHYKGLANWLKAIQVFSLVCFLLMGFYAFKLNAKTLLIVMGLAVITFFYAIPFWVRNSAFQERQNLRSIGGIKAYVVALVWAVVTVILPLTNAYFKLNFDVCITVVQRFAFVLALILPFDILDMRYDSLKLSTIPQNIGLKNTKILGVLLVLVAMLMEFLKDSLTATNLVVLGSVGCITVLFILFASKERNRYYSVFWVEAILVIWLVISLLLR